MVEDGVLTSRTTGKLGIAARLPTTIKTDPRYSLAPGERDFNPRIPSQMTNFVTPASPETSRRKPQNAVMRPWLRVAGGTIRKHATSKPTCLRAVGQILQVILLSCVQRMLIQQDLGAARPYV